MKKIIKSMFGKIIVLMFAYLITGGLLYALVGWVLYDATWMDVSRIGIAIFALVNIYVDLIITVYVSDAIDVW